MVKSILILKATKDICKNEIGLIQHHCQLLGMKVHVEELHSEKGLEEIVNKYSAITPTFDYIYLCTHGDKRGFLANMGGVDHNITWARFSQLICENGITKEDSILLLACCKGGLFQVASDILAVCNKINFVCGVKWNVAPWDLSTGFVVFLHNIINKEAEPVYAAQKASLATDYTFVCYDRDEVEGNPQYETRRWELYHQIGWTDDNSNVVTKDEKVLENTGLIDFVKEEAEVKVES